WTRAAARAGPPRSEGSDPAPLRYCGAAHRDRISGRRSTLSPERRGGAGEGRERGLNGGDMLREREHRDTRSAGPKRVGIRRYMEEPGPRSLSRFPRVSERRIERMVAEISARGLG